MPGSISSTARIQRSATATASGFSTLTFNDATAGQGHRQKTVYLSNNVALWSGSGDANEIAQGQELFNQSAMLIRTVVSGEGDKQEVAYANLGNPAQPWVNSSNERLVYEGSGRLKTVHGGWGSRYYKPGWKITGQVNGLIQVDGQFEDTCANTYAYNVPHEDYLRGTLPSIQDEQGRVCGYQYDSDGALTQKSYPDGTTEQYAYNEFKEVTRYQDRLGRVTKYTYDAQGNKLTQEVGILYDPQEPEDVNQPEHAVYQWDYYGDGDTDEHAPGVTQPKGFLKCTYEPTANGTKSSNFTKRVYNAQKLLSVVLEPNDDGTDVHVAQTLTYDGLGRLATSADVQSRTLSYTYDALNRVVKTTYLGDNNSTEEVLYGTGDQSHLLLARKDRNGIVTKYAYDKQSRLKETVEAVANVGVDRDHSHRLYVAHDLPGRCGGDDDHLSGRHGEAADGHLAGQHHDVCLRLPSAAHRPDRPAPGGRRRLLRRRPTSTTSFSASRTPTAARSSMPIGGPTGPSCGRSWARSPRTPWPTLRPW